MIEEIHSGNYTGIFNVTTDKFLALALEIFEWQRKNNVLYSKYCQFLGMGPQAINSVDQIPFLPVSFFKNHTVVSYSGGAEKIFTSSGTSGMAQSSHFVKRLDLYEAAFVKGFEAQYGSVQQYAFLCLLPAYLDREGSSLIYMAQHFIAASGQADSGFFLEARGELIARLKSREAAGKKTILLGVTFALLDFAADCPIQLQHTIVMETGGMKGRKIEITRAEVHQLLQTAFGVDSIHSEYGMTELLSQCYATKNGRYNCPPWLKVFIRSTDDPFELKATGAGLLCIIDLVNVYSCAFIETADLAKIYADGSFEILGRMDNSDLRGCSLLVL